MEVFFMKNKCHLFLSILFILTQYNLQASNTLGTIKDFCNTLNLEKHNNFRELESILKDPKTLRISENFIKILHTFNAKEIETEKAKRTQEVKEFLSYLMIYYFPSDIIALENQSSAKLHQNSIELMNQHAKLCKFIQSQDKNFLDTDEFLDLKKYLISFELKRSKHHNLFRNYLSESKKHLENSLIKKYVEIEERYLKTCHQIEKFDFDFVEEFSKQLRSIEKKLKLLNSNNIFERLNNARKKLYLRHTQDELEYLKHLKNH